MADANSGIKDSSGKPVKSILKKGKHKTAKPSFGEDASGGGPDGAGGIHWDEMNILMTEHPPDKDYGHMKIEEPKTPYHEMIGDDDEPATNLISPNDLASRVQEAATEGGSSESKWEREPSDSEEDETEAQQKHKEEFRQWRKKHYNEFLAVKRARELIAKDLAEAEAESEAGPSVTTPTQSGDVEDMQQDTSS